MKFTLIAAKSTGRYEFFAATMCNNFFNRHKKGHKTKRNLSCPQDLTTAGKTYSSVPLTNYLGRKTSIFINQFFKWRFLSDTSVVAMENHYVTEPSVSFLNIIPHDRQRCPGPPKIFSCPDCLQFWYPTVLIRFLMVKGLDQVDW